MATKKKNKFIVPQEYNQSVMFASGGQLFDSNGNIFAGGADLNLLQNIKAGNTQSAIGQGLGVVQGATQLGSQIFGNFDTSGIGKEVQSTNDISRGDVMNSNVNVDSMKSNVAGQSLTGAMTGAKAGMSIAGPLGAGIGAGVGLIGSGLSSIFGNRAKQRKADREAQQWTNNLEAKDRQFNQQDLRSNMANFSANGGDLFAYGGNIQSDSPLTEFTTGGRHEDNPNSGILQGTGANGQPNLVEQGETKHEDYIFSNRLKIDPKISKEFKLPAGLNGKTFAAASKYLSREGKDRPNDPISNKAIKAHLAKLTAAQEGLKEQMQPQQQQGIPMEGQPNANILAQGYANGGYIDQTHYNNPTHQGANVYAKGSQMKINRDNRFLGMDQLDTPLSGLNINQAKTPQTFDMNTFNKLNPTKNTQLTGIQDYSRYAPVAANMITGIGDMFQKPEVVKYGRVSPEMNTSHMDYQPIDTEWMNNKMNATYAGTRDQMINQAGGNRAIAMAGLSGINQQQQNAIGEAYMKAQDINYGRKNQATQFNAGIEAQNVAAQNAAQQANLQLQMQEMDANARNRAAKRNAARQAILNAASNIGDIGRENYAFKTGAQMTDYEVTPDGKIKYIGNNKKNKE